MTSEILIMNKNAIVMAADSAVTVDNKKSYMGVNKLFLLSNDPPMGIMIFGSADFVNVPLETLIKEYREQTDFKELGNINNIKEDFIEYLSGICQEDDFSRNLKNDLANFKKLLLREDCLENFFNSSDNAEIFSFLEEDEFNIDVEFKRLAQELEEKGVTVDVTTLKKCFSNMIALSSTGIVIAGFNQDDFFPSYISFNLIAKQGNKVIIKDIDSQFNYAGRVIIPFAQKDVITTFISGIDYTLENGIVNYFSNFMDLYSEEIVAAIKSNKNINEKDLSNVLKEIRDVKNSNEMRIEDFVKNIDIFKKGIYSPILESVGVLPKEDLSSLAESLIHITSLKRKIASDLESVGGDVDVAIISKGDGFIWKKRKQYFKPELNHHFFNKE